MPSTWKKKAPTEFDLPRKKRQVVSQVQELTYEVLTSIAEESGESLSAISAAVLDDYAKWYKSEGYKLRK